MDRWLWGELYRLIVELGKHHDYSGRRYSDACVALVYLWSVVHDRPRCWASDPLNWGGRCPWDALPSPSCLSRRLRTVPVLGQVPLSCLAEEIATPGEGQLRALVTIAGNPVLSAPDAGKLDAALPQLEFMVSLDNWLNETTRHADVILPGLSPLEQPHYDELIWSWAVRSERARSPIAESWRRSPSEPGSRTGFGSWVSVGTYRDCSGQRTSFVSRTSARNPSGSRSWRRCTRGFPWSRRGSAEPRRSSPR